MANDGKLYIIVTDQLPAGQGEPLPDKEKSDDKSKEGALTKFIQHKFFNFVETQAKQAVNYTVSNIGNFTGDYVTQQHVSDALQVVNFIMDLGSAAGAGASVGGGYGALIAVGIALVGKGITVGQEAYASWVEGTRTNRDIAQLRSRAGLNSTNNGSRGTDQ